LVIVDYEHIKLVTRSDWIAVPEVIPDDAIAKFANRVLKYPGIKEDVYASQFRPDPKFLEQLNLPAERVVVTVRPPATEAHYHKVESEDLFVAAIELVASYPETSVIILPRNHRQKMEIIRKWPQWIESNKLVIPDKVIDGLNLI